MAKGYWIGAYRSVSDPEKLAAYTKLEVPRSKRSEDVSSLVAGRSKSSGLA
jgi:hypothetical protein